MVQSNNSREAPLDDTMAAMYGYTLNVSPKKYLINGQYGNLSYDEQCEILTKVLQSAVTVIGRAQCENDYEFEKTKAGHAHCHGMMRCTEKEIYKMQMFCHRQLGFPKLDPSICFKYIKTLYNSEVWSNYMKKCKVPELEDTFMF